jgi:formate--tetrahydrofolate ligase
VIATECALGLADYTVTEAGFASDLGAEKFCDIVCTILGRGPDVIVVVATIKALQSHGDGDLQVGFANLARHLRHVGNYGPSVIVAINRFGSDRDEDHQEVHELCAQFGVPSATCDPFSGGGDACRSLASLVVELSQGETTFQPLYEPQDSLEQKLEKVIQKAYGGDSLELSPGAAKNLRWLVKNGFGQLPVCVAKTQYSLSDDATRKNAPEGFKVTVRELRLSAGAGFIVAVCGDIMLMPGLGKTPAALDIDIDEEGRIVGLF